MTFLGLLRQIDTELVFFHIGVSQVCQPSRNRPNRKDDPQKNYTGMLPRFKQYRML